MSCPAKRRSWLGCALALVALSPFNAGAESRWFAGLPVEGASDLVAMGARHYDARTGRFLQTDPLGIAADHLYAYAANNPYFYWDPTGLSPKSMMDDQWSVGFSDGVMPIGPVDMTSNSFPIDPSSAGEFSAGRVEWAFQVPGVFKVSYGADALVVSELARQIISDPIDDLVEDSVDDIFMRSPTKQRPGHGPGERPFRARRKPRGHAAKKLAKIARVNELLGESIGSLKPLRVGGIGSVLFAYDAYRLIRSGLQEPSNLVTPFIKPIDMHVPSAVTPRTGESLLEYVRRAASGGSR